MAEPSNSNLSEIFDLDRKGLTKQLVDNMEHCLRERDAASEDLRQIVASAKEAQFSRRDIEAMKTIAKLRMKDQKGAAQEKLEALQRVGNAVGFDLFGWASAQEQ